ncbi:translesion error-prone DNA polymerase V autoproteolytic subunit [Malikia spinosa]|uniref:LexA family protein n=1 Tax=Malikia spinosa TaxID=86180 RepID=UPI000AA5CEC0
MSRIATPSDLARTRQARLMLLWLQWRLSRLSTGEDAQERDFAAGLGLSPSQWSQHKAGKPLGPRLARQIEAARGQPAGWLDRPQEDSAAAPLRKLLEISPPDSLPATTQALAQALGIDPAAYARGLGLAESPTQAGFPSPAADHRIQRVDLNAELVQHEEATLLVRVRGESMRDVGIFDGNLLVVDKSLTPVHGDIVVAILDNEFTCKKLYCRDGLVKLQPANPDFPEIVPQEGQELRIWGVVTSTVTRFR